MKTSLLAQLLTGLAAALLVSGLACGHGNEGDRCNPDLSSGHDECGGGLQCTTPPECPESYCCPKSGTSNDPNCQAGCNGGAASLCNASGDVDACALACASDPQDLLDASGCSSGDGEAVDGGVEAGSREAAAEAGPDAPSDAREGG